MRRAIALLSAVFLAISVGFRVNAKDTYFKLLVSGPTVYRPGDSLNITVSVYDIKLDGGMSYVSFRLYYDSAKAVPVIKNGFTGDDENRSTFIVDCPDFESWEVIGILDEEECFYELTFGTESVSGLKTARANNALVFSIPFVIPAGTRGDVLFSVPEEYVNGGNASLTQREAPGRANDVVIKDSSINYIPGVNNISETSLISIHEDKPLSVLTDGDKAKTATSANDAGVVLFRNLISNAAGSYPNVELLMVFENVRTVNKISICFFYDFDSGVGLPKDGVIRISHSQDSTSFAYPDAYNLNLDVRGTKGVAEALITLEKPEKIKYLKLAFAFGDSLLGSNTDLEFIGLTELQTYYESESEVGDPLELKNTSKWRIENGYLLGVPDNVTVEDIKSNFKREVTVSGTGTGSTVSAGGHTIVIIVAGDTNGDGKITSIDCLRAKKARIGTLTLPPAQLKAACIQGGSLPTPIDILKLKKHILGFDYIHDHR